MALQIPKAILLHAVLANISTELATINDIICIPGRLPPELLLIIRAYLLTSLTDHLFKQSTEALAEYEDGLQRLLCPDCISYNHDIYGPDIWQWQHFSGPCNCVQTPLDTASKPSTIPQQFINPHHWLEHHLSLQAAHLFAASSPSLSIWDVVIQVLNRHHCELLREDIDDFTSVQGLPLFPSSINVFYYRRVFDYYGAGKQSQTPPSVRIQPLPSALRLLESKGIGEAGRKGDMFRADIILCQVSRDLGLTLELKDVFSSPREPPVPASSWTPRKAGSSDVPVYRSTLLHYLTTSPLLHSAIKSYSFLSTVFATCVSIPMTVATLALTIVCFYSRSIAFRVGT